MQKIQLLDVTLRDGGYCNNFKFGEKVSSRIIHSLQNANIDYIEIGYRNGSAKPIEHIGENGLCTTTFVSALKLNNPNSKLVVILHAKNCSREDIDDLNKAGVSMIRFCITTDLMEHEKDLITYAKQRGLITSGNITRVTERDLSQLEKITLELTQLNIDVIYLADSNGSLTPERTKFLFSALQKISHCQFGFHAHDNLGLALANTLAAIEAGVTIIDASLGGMGKGGGNLSTEKIIAYLESIRADYKYNLLMILHLVDQLKKENILTANENSMKSLLLGTFNLSIDDERKITEGDLSHYYHAASNIGLQKKLRLAC